MIEHEEVPSSATQVELFEACVRKWTFRYIHGIEGPPNAFAVLGVETHGHLESWLRAGVVPDGDDKGAKLARALVPHLPAPQQVDPLNVETNQLFRIGGVEFILKVDLFMPVWEGGRPRVFDHKTSGDFKWAKGADVLPNDVQGSLYAAWGLVKTGATMIDLQWNYVRTKGAIVTLPVIKTGVTHAMVEERLVKSITTAKRSQLVRRHGLTAAEVPYNPGACEDYGGCPYKEHCNLSEKERMRSIMSQTQSAEVQDFFTKLNAHKNNGATVAPASTPQPVNPPVTTPAPQPAAAPAPQASFPTAPVAPPVQQTLPGTTPVVNPFLAAMNKRREGEAAAQAAASGGAPAPAPAPAPVPQQETVLSAAQPTPQPEPEAPKKGRGRPKASTSEPNSIDIWVTFATASLRELVRMQFDPAAAANGAAQYADQMLAEMLQRGL